MPKIDVFNTDGGVVGQIDLSEEIFGAEINEPVVHTAVVAYLANQRQGTKSTKTRAEVRGGGAKPRPQKGTGRARQGSTRSPQWVGGGVVFAPKPRDFSVKMNKKEKRIALKSALSSKVLNENIIVLDKLSIDTPKTKEMAKIFKNLNAAKALLVIPENDKGVMLSARNIPGVKTASPRTINTYDILRYEKFIVTRDAVQTIEEVYA